MSWRVGFGKTFCRVGLVVALAGGAALVGGGCGPSAVEKTPPVSRPARQITPAFEHKVAVKTSVLRLGLDDDPALQGKSAKVVFKGFLDGGAAFEHALVAPLVWLRDQERFVIDIPVQDGLWAVVNPSPSQTFTGTISISVEDLIGPVLQGDVRDVLVFFTDTIVPRALEVDQITEARAGQRLGIGGDGFLRPEEGTTWAIVESGTITYEGGESRDVSGRRAPVRWNGSRTDAFLPLSPEIFGVRPMTFTGSLKLVNALGPEGKDGSFDSPDRVALSFQLKPSFISAIEPAEGSRGQHVTLVGAGFLESDDQAGYSMLLQYEGVFRPDGTDTVIDYRGARAITRLPFRVVDDRTIEQDVWYAVNDQTFALEGLGATPGAFEGTITPILVAGQEEQIGAPWQGTFRVLPTRQVVHVRFLPGFGQALERFGLRNVEREVRDRVLAVMRRDYDGIALDLTETPPDDFADYMTVEIGGEDPTGQGLFGYDNSFNGVPKDTGNLFLRDYLGGYNLTSQGAGFVPYGGVFIESFVIYSPKLSTGGYETFEAFDATLKPFMAELGGDPVRATEWPDGSRAEAIRQAILLIGNLAGHTASHEIGHSLGLPYVEGEDPDDPVYHNQAEGPVVYLMDPGARRTFGLRAELDDAAPVRFSPESVAYLKRILPLRR